MKIIKWLNKHFEETLLIILLVLITCVSFLQVVIRKIPWIPALTWAEEFCRFCWIWSVFLSLPFTIYNNSMLRVSIVIDSLPKAIKKIINLIVDAIIVASMLLLFVYSIEVVLNIKKSNEQSAAMLWPMWCVYSIMIVGLCLSCVRGCQKFVEHLLQRNEKSLKEKTMDEAIEETKLVTKEVN